MSRLEGSNELDFPCLIGEPFAFGEPERSEFADLVISEGKVAAHGLIKRIESAELLAVVKFGSAIIGTGSIKNPDAGYAHGVFQKAGCLEDAVEYQSELGWVVVDDNFRKRGLSQIIVGGLLKVASRRKRFATTGRDNGPMRHVLEKFGFRLVGSPFKGKEEVLVLFIAP